MRKSSAIFVGAIALGLAVFVPLRASAQGVSIYIGPGYPGYDAGYAGYDYYPPYPRAYGYGYPRLWLRLPGVRLRLSKLRL